MSSKLDLDPGVIASCREAAAQIAEQVGEEIANKTTVSVERRSRGCWRGRGQRAGRTTANVLVDHVADVASSARASATAGNALLDDESRSPHNRRGWDSRALDLCALPRAQMARQGSNYARVRAAPGR